MVSADRLACMTPVARKEVAVATASRRHGARVATRGEPFATPDPRDVTAPINKPISAHEPSLSTTTHRGTRRASNGFIYTAHAPRGDHRIPSVTFVMSSRTRGVVTTSGL